MARKGVYYSDYLAIDALLELQQRQSVNRGHPAPDEMLFIITHQTYELWFKQIRFELDRVMDIFKQPEVKESDVLLATHLLERIGQIIDLMVQQVDVLETMTPLDFLDFRDDLVPASGFQSWQFRLIETRLGLKPFGKSAAQGGFLKSLDAPHRQMVEQAAATASLFDLVHAWLERTPFVRMGAFDFWAHYKAAVHDMLMAEEQIIRANHHLDDNEKEEELHKTQETRRTFEVIFSRKTHEQLQKDGQWRLSYDAIKAALLIMLYRDEPLLNGPFRLLTALTDIDQRLTAWRQRHMQLAQRMIGRKISTGGMSAGSHDYLAATVMKNRIFADFTALSTFLIPRSKLPDLPKEVRKQLDFSFNKAKTAS